MLVRKMGEKCKMNPGSLIGSLVSLPWVETAEEVLERITLAVGGTIGDRINLTPFYESRTKKSENKHFLGFCRIHSAYEVIGYGL